jgi:hypothetical protein
MTVDFAIGNATTFDNHLILSDGHQKDYFSIDLDTRTLNKFEFPKSLFDLTANGIEEFHFEIGSQGCFHSDNRRRSYYRKGNVFELNRKESKSDFLMSTPQTIEQSKITELIKAIENSRFNKVAVSELGLTDRDITSFKKFIDNEEKRIKKNGIDKFDYKNLYSFPGERADFDFYRNSADSISSLSSDIVDNVFWLEYGNWSTTTEWRRVVFVFKDNRKLIVENSDDKPNYLFTPWTVDFEGLKFRSNSISFGQSINELTSGNFFGKTASDKNYAIFKITDFLYRVKLQSTD